MLRKSSPIKIVHCLDRYPVDGKGIVRPLLKSGHGSKFTWEGPADMADNELDAAPSAIDEKDPNYVDVEEAEDAKELVVGEVDDVAKAVEEWDGVGRVDIHPCLKVN